MKRFRFLALTLLTAAACATEVRAQTVDGLLWGVDPATGRSCPYATPNVAQPGMSYIIAYGKLDKQKYNGYNAPTISYDNLTPFLYVTPLNAQGQPVAAQMVQFQGTASNNTGGFSFNTSNSWDPTANGGMGGTKPFAGFAAGSYEVKVVAKITLYTPAKENPPPQPPTPAKTEKRDAILLTSPFQIR
jgi:hypothetical protein